MGTIIAVCMPDIGDFHDVPVIEILAKPGDRVAVGDPLVMLESDKATMDVPAAAAGVVRTVVVKIGDRVSKGSTILTLEAATGTQAEADAVSAGQPPAMIAEPIEPAMELVSSLRTPPAQEASTLSTAPPGPSVVRDGTGDGVLRYCGPAVRRMARELGVDLALVRGSGSRGRIIKGDVLAHVKQALAAPSVQVVAIGGANLPPWPKVDFAKFGPVEVQALSRIQRLSGGNLARNWAAIPHVTNHHDADITELEAFRKEVNLEIAAQGVKVTSLAFVIKACAAALRAHPRFNASLDGDNLVLKHYAHVGFAVDTPNGLVVPVLRNADRKGVIELARESTLLAQRAREGQLKSDDMQGGCFTVSSLGSSGGSYFTPIINAPEVAILGVSSAVTRPVWNGREFLPRLMLPLSLSWDHRVLDGVAAARFNHFLVTLLGDFRRLAL